MIEAVVQAGSHETTYRRAGYGAAVLVLIGLEDVARTDWLFEGLSSRFRTFAPVLPPGLEDPDDAGFPLLELWLRGLIDGLGLERPALVAGAGLGTALLRFAALDPHRLTRVALVHRGPGDPDGHRALTDAARAIPHPVLVTPVPESEEPEARQVALVALLDFLSAAPDAPADLAHVSTPTLKLS